MESYNLPIRVGPTSSTALTVTEITAPKLNCIRFCAIVEISHFEKPNRTYFPYRDLEGIAPMRAASKHGTGPYLPKEVSSEAGAVGNKSILTKRWIFDF